MGLSRRAALAALGAWGAAADARAGDEGLVRYGGDAAFAPFESLDAQGRPRGFQVDLLAELARQTGLRIEVRLGPWPQTEQAFRAGELDLIALVDTPERRAWAVFGASHATPAFGIYHRAAEPGPQSLQDLSGKRLAVLDGEPMRVTRRTWLKELQALYLPQADAAQALAAVARGQADFALMPRAYGDPALAAASGVAASGFSPRLQPYAFAVAPGREALLQRLQQGLDTLERNGRLEALRMRWLSSHHESAARTALEHGLALQRDWTWGLAGASTAAITALGIGLQRRGRRVALERGRRRTAEDALKRAEVLLERSFTRHPEAMLIVERESGTVLDANLALLALLGVAADGVVGQAVAGLGRHVDAGALQQLVQSLDRDGALDAAPLKLQRADGAARDCLVSAERLAIDGREHVFCILRDVTEQLARDARLREAYDAMAARLAAAREGQAQAEGALQEFTRAVAHDLKAPLRAVQGFVALLRERLRTGHVQEAQAYGEQIERATVRMQTMVQALGALAQVGRAPLRRAAVDMQRLAGETWAMLAAAVPQRTVAFRCAELPPAMADAALTAQVWQNLLDNAWKYTARAPQPQVSVDSFRNARGTWYRVTDNGAGFDMAQAGRLFQPFQRMHAGSDFAGTGVGLSLVRRIVEHHGGEIRVRSAPGVGTVAEFTLDALPG